MKAILLHLLLIAVSCLLVGCISQAQALRQLESYMAATPHAYDAAELSARLMPLFNRKQCAVPFLVHETASPMPQTAIAAYLALAALAEQEASAATPQVREFYHTALLPVDRAALVKHFSSMKSQALPGNWPHWYELAHETMQKYTVPLH